jgi:hypothetical protein
MIVQTTANEAAAALARQVDGLLATLAADADLRDAVPNFAELAKRLTPKVERDQLTLELDAAEISAAQPIVLAVLRSAERSIASRLPAPKPPEK